jgi:hypothetical protein
VQGEHSTLAFRLAAGQALLNLVDGLRVETVQEPLRLGPRLLGGVAGDDVEPDAVARRAPMLTGQPSDPRQLLGYLVRRLAPGEVDIGVSCRDWSRRTCSSTSWVGRASGPAEDGERGVAGREVEGRSRVSRR